MVLSEKVEFLSTFILPVLNEEIFQKYKLSIFACFVNSVCVVLQLALDTDHGQTKVHRIAKTV